jgi:hypothetical protein
MVARQRSKESRMVPIRLEHFITSTHAATVEAQLERYRQAGFLPQDTTVRHDPGLRNGFVSFGPEYIELAWVEDEALFAAGGGIPGIQTYHATARPWGIGLEVADVRAAHEAWRARGYDLAPVFSRGVRDAAPDDGPAWSFQPIPGDLLPGALCFALTYHGVRRDAPRRARIAPNTTYAIDGVTLVAAEPQSRASRWRAFLAPGEPVQQMAGAASVRIGPHTATWLTPGEYRRRYGRDWRGAPHDRGEMALLHLLAENLGAAEGALIRAGLVVERLQDRDGGPAALLVAPVAQDGFTFLIAEEPPEEWAARRHALTGELFDIAR